MANGTKAWYEQMADWWLGNKENTAKRDELLQVYQGSSLRRLLKGEIPLDSVSEGRKLRLYHLTSLPFFKTTDEDPRLFDLEKVRSGEQRRSLVGLWLEYHGIPKSEAAKKFGVKTPSLYRYIIGRTELRQSDVKKIEEGLALLAGDKHERPHDAAHLGYRSQKTATEPMPVRGQKSAPQENRSLFTGFDALCATLESLRQTVAKKLPTEVAAEIVGRNYTPTLEQRIAAVTTAIDILGTQIDYFRRASTSHEERLELAQVLKAGNGHYIKVALYVAGILNTIDLEQDKNPAETLLRMFPPPKKEVNS